MHKISSRAMFALSFRYAIWFACTSIGLSTYNTPTGASATGAFWLAGGLLPVNHKPCYKMLSCVFYGSVPVDFGQTIHGYVTDTVALNSEEHG